MFLAKNRNRLLALILACLGVSAQAKTITSASVTFASDDSTEIYVDGNYVGKDACSAASSCQDKLTTLNIPPSFLSAFVCGHIITFTVYDYHGSNMMVNYAMTILYNDGSRDEIVSNQNGDIWYYYDGNNTNTLTFAPNDSGGNSWTSYNYTMGAGWSPAYNIPKCDGSWAAPTYSGGIPKYLASKSTCGGVTMFDTWSFRQKFNLTNGPASCAPTLTPTPAPPPPPPPGCVAWTTAGSAIVDGLSRAVLTSDQSKDQAGAAWSSSCVDFTKNLDYSFKAYFGSSGQGEGMSFVIQRDPRGTAAVGQNGGNMGYSGAGTVMNSLALAIKTQGSNGQIEVRQNGSGGGDCTYAFQPCPYNFTTDVKNGAEHDLRVTWDYKAKLLRLYVDGNLAMSYARDIITDFLQGSCATIGFTAGTSGNPATQYVRAVSCAATTPPPPSSCTGWTTVGNAYASAQGVTLTVARGQVGAGWSASCIDLNTGFDLSFKTFFGGPGAAEGMGFVLQRDPRGTAALGSGGGDRGYSGGGGVTPSLAFMIQSNSGNGYLEPRENGGGSTCGYAGAPCGYTFATDIKNNAEHDWRMTWDPPTRVLKMYFDSVLVMTYTRDLVAAVFGGNTCVYYGFSAASGGNATIQYVKSVSCLFPNPPSPTFTRTPTRTATSTFSPTPTPTATPTRTPSRTPSATPTQTWTRTATPSHTPSVTLSSTPSHTPTFTPTATLTRTNTPGPSPTPTFTFTATPTFSSTSTSTPTFSMTSTRTATRTPTPTYTVTLTRSPTSSVTLTMIYSPTATRTSTPTFTATPTRTATASATPSFTFTASYTPTPTLTYTESATATRTQTPSYTASATLSRTPTATSTFTVTPTFTPSPLPLTHHVTISAYNAAGERVKTLFEGNAQYQPGELKTRQSTVVSGPGASAFLDFPGFLSNALGVLESGLAWDLTNDSGQAVDGGVYYFKAEIKDSFGQVTALIAPLQVVQGSGANELQVYNSAGELVWHLDLAPLAPAQVMDIALAPGQQAFAPVFGPDGKLVSSPLAIKGRDLRGASFDLSWDGRSDRGQPVASGTYIIQVVERSAQGTKIVVSRQILVLATSGGPDLSAAQIGPNPLLGGSAILTYIPSQGCMARATAFSLSGEKVGGATDSMASGRMLLEMGTLSPGVYIIRLEEFCGGGLSALRLMKIAVLH